MRIQPYQQTLYNLDEADGPSAVGEVLYQWLCKGLIPGRTLRITMNQGGFPGLGLYTDPHSRTNDSLTDTIQNKTRGHLLNDRALEELAQCCAKNAHEEPGKFSELLRTARSADRMRWHEKMIHEAEVTEDGGVLMLAMALFCGYPSFTAAVEGIYDGAREKKPIGVFVDNLRKDIRAGVIRPGDREALKQHLRDTVHTAIAGGDRPAADSDALESMLKKFDGMVADKPLSNHYRFGPGVPRA